MDMSAIHTKSQENTGLYKAFTSLNFCITELTGLNLHKLDLPIIRNRYSSTSINCRFLKKVNEPGGIMKAGFKTSLNRYSTCIFHTNDILRWTESHTLTTQTPDSTQAQNGCSPVSVQLPHTLQFTPAVVLVWDVPGGLL